MVSALKELTIQLERNPNVDNKVNTNNTVTLNKTVGVESINLVAFLKEPQFLFFNFLFLG